jgi:hypothetical protein
MPRKKTGMPFEAHPSPKVAENGEKLLYVKPQSGLVRTHPPIIFPYLQLHLALGI